MFVCGFKTRLRPKARRHAGVATRDAQMASGRNLGNIRKQKNGMRTSAPLQICHDRFARWPQPFPTHDRACFGSEKKFIRAAKIVERLNAKTISSKKN